MKPSSSFRRYLIVTLVLVSSFSSAQTVIWEYSGGPIDQFGGWVNCLALSSGGDLYAGTHYGGVYVLRHDTTEWRAINTGIPNSLIWCLGMNSQGHLFVGVYFDGIYRSMDSGSTWTPINSGLTSLTVASIAFDPNDNIFIGTEGGGVFRSSDNGDHWTAVNAGLTVNNIIALHIAPNGHIFAGSFDGGAFRSTNGGASWAPLAGLNHPHIAVLVSNVGGDLLAANGGVVAAGFTNGIYRSTDDGENWNRIYSDPTYDYVHALALNSQGHIYAGVWADGVIRSTDNGVSWTRENLGLANVFVRSLAIDDRGNIFAGTHHLYQSPPGGIYRSLESTVTSVPTTDNTLGKSYALLQNYPNPFNPTTTIRFNILKDSYVRLRIYNILGQAVATLIDDKKQAGLHEVIWNASDMPSGAYFYRLMTDAYTETKTLVFSR